MDSRLVDRIYQAAIVSDTWPDVLQEIADGLGAKGAHFLYRSPTVIDAVTSPAIARDVADFFAEGWAVASTHADALIAEMAPAFRAETDYHSAEEIAKMPVHAQFLDPRGFHAGAGTVVQGAGDYIIQFSVEGFPSHSAASQALTELNGLRPDLARALSLTSLHRSQSAVVVESLALAGVGAAIVNKEGALRAANNRFVERLGNHMIELGGRLRFTSGFLNERLSLALQRHIEGECELSSIPVADKAGGKPFALHLLPILGRAREFCDADGVLLLISESSNASVPNSDLLRSLFDLTPAEARLARALLTGSTLDAFAAEIGVKKHTAKTQLRSIFGKTGVSRQTELALLLTGLGRPG